MMRFFSYIQADHSFYPLIELLRGAIRSSPTFSLMENNKNALIRADLSQSFVPGTGWEPGKFYWSFQYREECEPFRFHAITFYSTSKEENRIHSCLFPSDPFLESVQRFFLKQFSVGLKEFGNAKTKVLQYTPFRRLAVLVTDEASDSVSLVCKFKKRTRYKLAYEKLVHVFEAGRGSPLPFSLAAPIQIDHQNGVFFQETKKGKDLSASIHALNFKTLMGTLGSLHYDLQQLRVSGMPEFEFPAFLNELKKNIDWILYFRPGQKEMLNGVREILLENPPALDPMQFRFCHGDFVCSQILIDEDQWSVIDFDLAMRADPYLEMGRLVASLKYDVPFFCKAVSKPDPIHSPCLNEAIESYLGAYDKKSDQPFCRKRLLWYQMWYEVFYISLMFKKDRFDSDCYQYANQSLLELSPLFLKMRNYITKR